MDFPSAVGGLIVGQTLTLFAMPFIYVFFDRLQGRLFPKRAPEKQGGALPHVQTP